jgi:receptor expression-enhancing protein 5/6
MKAMRGTVIATLVAIVLLKDEFKGKENEWQLLVDKAKTWMKEQGLKDPDSFYMRIKFNGQMVKKHDFNLFAPLFFFGMFMTLFMAYMFGTLIFIATLTILYPSFQSIRTIQTIGREEDDKAWLIYWMVFGTFSALDSCVGFLLELIPYYRTVRFLFLVWLLVPKFNGARFVYEKVMRPMLKANQGKIMGLIKKTHEVTAKATADIAKSVNDAAQAQSKLAE